MGYPYGDMQYPTFEELENEYSRKKLETVYYYELFKIVEEAQAAYNEKRLSLSLEGGGTEHFGFIEAGTYPEEASADEKGLAFARALAYVLDDTQIDRFFQDLFAILEDKVVSRADAEAGEWSEDSSRAYHLGAIRQIAKKSPSQAKDYAQDIEEIECERRKFVERKVEEVVARSNDNAAKAGLDEVRAEFGFADR